MSGEHVSIMITSGSYVAAALAQADVHKGPGEWWLARLIVQEPYRRRGLGSRALKALQEVVSTFDGFKYLEVAPGGYDTDPEVQVKFYVHNGFEKHGPVPGTFRWTGKR